MTFWSLAEANMGDVDTDKSRQNLPLLVVRRDLQVLPAAPSRLRRTARRLRFVPLVMGLVMLGGFVGLYFQPPGLRLLMAALHLEPGGGTATPIAVPPPRPAPPSTAPRVVVGLARVVPEGEVVTVAPPFGAGDARIAALRVREGDAVAEGDVVAVLDNERPLLAALAAARATVASREAALAQTRAGVAASRDEAQAALARAEATAANAAREFERVEELRRRGFAADQAYEQRRTQRDEAAREAERLRATLSRYRGDPASQPDVVVALRALDAARADAARTEAELDKAYVRAPLAATVLSIAARPGEKPGAAGIMNLGAIDRMTLDIEVYQSQIGRVALGDAVEASAEALPQALKGEVTRVGLEIARQTLTDPSPAASTDARVVTVTARLDPASNALARRFTNLQVTARILVRPQP
jgi:HlyD family secretion protein